ncbi:MAG: hypothetical protein EXS25_09385 [Pedosphaera sp.]|nr:hypothetical protein [Pedosphaera sp.]
MHLRAWFVFIGLFMLVSSGALGQSARFIRFRNETVSTPVPPALKSRQTLAKSDSPRLYGLYVIQLEAIPDEIQRVSLETAGVSLISPVPDDAFICYLTAAKSATVRALPFVRWLGEYRPDWRLDSRLLRRIAHQPAATHPIRAVLRAGASASEQVQALKQFQGPVHRTLTRHGTYIAGSLTGPRILALARSEFVLWIEPDQRMRLVDEIATKIVLGDEPNLGTLAAVQRLGFDGRGVVVAVADSGIDTGDAATLHRDLFGRVDAFIAYGGLEDASDEHSHGTHCAGIVAGNASIGAKDEAGYFWGLGVAPGAHLVAQRLFDGTGDYFPPPSYEALTRDAVRAGAYVGSNSWGDDTQGRYDLSAAEFDALVRDADSLTPGEQPYVLEFSAGNSGPGEQTIGSPAVAKNVIATGACQNDRFNLALYAEGAEVMADFSSRGPAEDGRIKPDITAPGTWIASLKSQFASDANAWLPIDENYLFQGGTSQSGPHVSGACAVFIQWYRETHGGITPSPALVKAALINSSVDMATAEVPIDPEEEDGGVMVVGDTPPVPNNDEGWGRIDLNNLIASERRFEFTEQSTGLRTGALFEKRVIVGSDDMLKITLTYTDVPGLPAAIPALVNDLDLEVISPDGLLYRGNAFLEGETVSNTAAGDRLNNVEAVHLQNPAAGEWIVRVRAVRVLQDVHGHTQSPPEQDFALVVSGQIPAPGEGVISWDRQTYRAPSTATLRLVDSDLRNQVSTEVHVYSDSQTTPLTLTLLRSGASGSFTGAVQLVRTPVNGSLLIANGDELTLSYTDTSPAGLRTRLATADLDPPAIDGLRAISRFGRVVIHLQSAEPVRTVVHVVPVNGSYFTVTNSFPKTTPEILLPELVPDSIYRFYVVATDEAGNISTNDNAGRLYFFTGPRPAKALLLYSPEQLFAQLGMVFPGIENWTAPLDALGTDYEIWNFAETNTVPSAAILASYRLVIWRPEELGTLPPGLAANLTGYVQGGGALFVASSEILSRLSATEQSVRTNLLHVADFITDGGASSLTGILGDPISSGLDLTLNFDDFPDFGSLLDFSTFPDSLQPKPEAAPILTQEDKKVVGLRYPRTGEDSRGRVVFLSIPFEAVPAESETSDNRTTLLGRCIDFLVPGMLGGSTLTFDQAAYTLPSSVVIELTDAARSGQSTVEVQFTSSADIKGIAVPLIETPLKGLFRGRLTLITNSLTPTINQLSAGHGDALTATYDPPAGLSRTALAKVDTVKPILSGVTVDPAYNEAEISWSTDKPSDALVRFGEGSQGDSFLSRSAYSAVQSTQHSLQLTGLQPDREYTFFVSGRDAAGNVGADDNGGRLFRIRTLRPASAPWLDTLETGRTGWATYDDDAFDDETGENLLNTTWHFGNPVNRHGVTSFSGKNCWATNLGGEAVDTAIADLISPAVDLRNGNKATLRFRTWYDTTERSDLLDFELCQVAISTNNGAAWSDLAGFGLGDISDGWEEVALDISRFTGHVVRLRFNYQLLSFESTDRPGWFIDDLSIGLSSLSGSSLEIAANLSQASFTLRGPVGFEPLQGTGRSLSVSNALPGLYSLQWGNVPDYIPPAPISATLGTNRLTLTGHYTLPDANKNEISDLWETRYFEALFAAGTNPELDSDGDGVGNRSEFLAGTDPKNSDSFLRLNLPSGRANLPVSVTWASVLGRDYQLEISADLFLWSSGGALIRGTGGTHTSTFPALLGRGAYCFRVRVNP